MINIKKQIEAVTAIRKKLSGGLLNYKEIYNIMDEISHHRLGNVLTTYFAASGYSRGFSDEELYYLTKAMIDTGETLYFEGIVADKHSIGGIPGTRTTLIVVPIIAAAGFTIPKSSSRAITTPSGTADDMEILAPVKFTKKRLYEIVEKTNGCIVWGGSFNIAPADDIIIKVEKPLSFESYDKILVSIMAKKIAFGSTHVVIDIPYGPMANIQKKEEAELLNKKFIFLAKRFNIKIRCLMHKTIGPIGRGIGPALESRDAMRVLQQKNNRPLDLEERSLNLAESLLELCLKDSPRAIQDRVHNDYENCREWASHLLKTGIAYEKMQEIIHEQGGESDLDSEDIKPGKYKLAIISHAKGIINNINIKNITILAKILGAPSQKGSGIYLEKMIGENIGKEELLYTLFSESANNLNEAKESLINFPIYKL